MLHLTTKEIAEFIESFNNAVFKRYEYNEFDGQAYIYFRASKFAADGIAKASAKFPELRSKDYYRMCIS